MYGPEVNTYRQTDILTADPKRLVILCYEGAIQSLNLAKAKYLSKEYEAKGKAIQKVLDILGELREALDFERGGEIANHLDSLYSFMVRHILKADLKKNVNAIDQVVVMLEELKSAWETAFYSLQNKRNVIVPQGELDPIVSKGGVLLNP
jgi:flagellar protein FliS